MDAPLQFLNLKFHICFKNELNPGHPTRCEIDGSKFQTKFQVESTQQKPAAQIESRVGPELQ